MFSNLFQKSQTNARRLRIICLLYLIVLAYHRYQSRYTCACRRISIFFSTLASIFHTFSLTRADTKLDQCY